MKYPGDDIVVMKTWEAVLKRPSMYLGKRSLYGLQCFIAGSPPEFWQVDWFEKWVADKTKQKGKSFDIALILSDNDDEKALDVWSEWFTEFKL